MFIRMFYQDIDFTNTKELFIAATKHLTVNQTTIEISVLNLLYLHYIIIIRT